jgi:hypothetical protein
MKNLRILKRSECEHTTFDPASEKITGKFRQLGTFTFLKVDMAV